MKTNFSRLALGIITMIALPILVSCSVPQPQPNKIDLVGVPISGDFSEWRVNKLSELLRFELKGKYADNDVIKCKVFIQLSDPRFAYFGATISMNYKVQDGKWKLESVCNDPAPFTITLDGRSGPDFTL